MTISPWESFAKVDSPDGRFTAVYDDAMEIAMGAPTRGVLKITDKLSGRCVVEVSDANASFVWSADSGALAIPRWTSERSQRLVIVRISNGTTRQLTGEYRVLQLESFQCGEIKGVDSPIHRPRTILVKAEE